MSVLESLAMLALDGVAVAYPPAAPIIAIIQKIEPYVAKASPVVQAAIKEGPAAFTAAKTAAPEFFAGLQRLAVELNVLKGGASPVDDADLAVLAGHIVGVDPPGWAHQDTILWWARASDNLG